MTDELPKIDLTYFEPDLYKGPMPPKPIHPTSTYFMQHRLWIEGTHNMPGVSEAIVAAWEKFIETRCKEWIK